MKKINDMKKQLREVTEVSDVWTKINEVSGEIKQLKTDANSIHNEIQKKARLSQEKHEQMIEFSKHVDELKKAENEAFQKFSALKSEFTASTSSSRRSSWA
jgi:uncharacterized coiled-coil DUF342 family protein